MHVLISLLTIVTAMCSAVYTDMEKTKMTENSRASFEKQFQLPITPFGIQAVYMNEVPVIDGRFDFSPSLPWVPLLDVDWRKSRASAAAWFRLGWQEEGLYVAVQMPSASVEELMGTGRTPDAPFTVHLGLDAQSEPNPGGIGRYVLRFVPLVEPVTMITRPF